MKKRLAKPVPIEDEAIVEKAKEALRAEAPARRVKCVVCGADGAPISDEALCWVCRRLKISAWRDNDVQMTSQE